MSIEYKIVKDTETEVVCEKTIQGITLKHSLIPIWKTDNDEYLIFKNLMEMSSQRMIVFQNIQELEKIGMNKAELQKLTSEIKEACQLGDTHSAFSKAEYIENTLKDHWDVSNTMRAIIPLCIVKRSEIQMLGTYDQELCEKNMKEIEDNPQILEFFFYLVQKFMENSQKSVAGISNNFLESLLKTKATNLVQSNSEPTKKSLLSEILTKFS